MGLVNGNYSAPVYGKVYTGGFPSPKSNNQDIIIGKSNEQFDAYVRNGNNDYEPAMTREEAQQTMGLAVATAGIPFIGSLIFASPKYQEALKAWEYYNKQPEINTEVKLTAKKNTDVKPRMSVVQARALMAEAVLQPAMSMFNPFATPIDTFVDPKYKEAREAWKYYKSHGMA